MRTRGALALAGVLLLLGVSAPAEAAPPDFRHICQQYWLMQAYRSCAWLLNSPNTEARPFLYRSCVHSWLTAHAP